MEYGFLSISHDLFEDEKRYENALKILFYSMYIKKNGNHKNIVNCASFYYTLSINYL